MATPIPTLCLNMIVKNESRVIRRLLSSVANIVDSYCICDTGSTDNTVDIIRSFFAENNIPGKIEFEPFRDFGHNRSVALKYCEEESAGFTPPDYVLLLDADMIFKLGDGVSPEEFKRGLTKDVYYIYQGSESFYHKNVRIVKNRIGACYWGVTHEYLKSPPGAVYSQIAKSTAFINDIGDGGSKSDKFVRDIRLLKKGLEENPGNDRYTFYLANSYRDNGDTELAIATYKDRIKLGGWHEEIWYSYYNIGKCYKSLGDMVQAVHWWLEGYQFYPKRIENLYEIINYYRLSGKSELAYLYYNMAIKQVVLNPNADFLFMARDVYEYKLDYEFSVFGYYCNVDKYDMTRVCMKVLNSKLTEDSIARNVLSNYKFYAPKLYYKANFPEQERLARVFKNIGRDLVLAESPNDPAEFVSSSPSLAIQSDGEVLAINVRYVNYRINDQGGYENRDHISTINVLSQFRLPTMQKIQEGVLWYNKEHDGLYVGLEDVRLFCGNQTRGELLYNANRGLGHSKLVVEHGVAGYSGLGDPYPNGIIYKNNGQRNVEKNWVLFEDAEGNTKIIYEWHDLIIGNLVRENELASSDDSSIDSDDEVVSASKKTDYLMVPTHTVQTPECFKYLRGSTNGVYIQNEDGTPEIWFICHAVSYEDRRYYYHAFVVLDAQTYQVKRYTPLFTFEGEKVEYTLGFVYYQDSFIIGYSVMDCSTKYMVVPKREVEKMFIII